MERNIRMFNCKQCIEFLLSKIWRGYLSTRQRTFVEGAKSTREGNLRQSFNPLTSPAGRIGSSVILIVLCKNLTTALWLDRKKPILLPKYVLDIISEGFILSEAEWPNSWRCVAYHSIVSLGSQSTQKLPVMLRSCKHEVEFY